MTNASSSEPQRRPWALIVGLVVAAAAVGGGVWLLIAPGLEQKRLVDQLQEPGPRTFAFERLLEQGERAVPALLDALNDPGYTAREEVVNLLGRIGDRRAVDAVIAVDDPELAVPRLHALGGLRGPKALEEVMEALYRGNRQEELAALTVLTDWPDDDHDRAEEINVELLDYLDDEFPGHRALAAEALGRRHHEPAVAPLIERLADEEPAVREKAAWALIQIGGAEAEAAVEAAYESGAVTFQE